MCYLIIMDYMFVSPSLPSSSLEFLTSSVIVLAAEDTGKWLDLEGRALREGIDGFMKDHDLSQRQTLNRLSYPGAPGLQTWTCWCGCTLQAAMILRSSRKPHWAAQAAILGERAPESCKVEVRDAWKFTCKLLRIPHLSHCLFMVINCFRSVPHIFYKWFFLSNPTGRCSVKGIWGIVLASPVKCRGPDLGENGWQWHQSDNRQFDGPF